MRITIEIKGDREVREKLGKFGLSLLNLSREMEQIGDGLQSYYENESFASQGGVFSAQWARLSARYAIIKAKKWPGRGIEEASGTMRKSFYHVSTSDSVRISNQADYFKYQQSGTSRGLPQRLIMAINETNKTMIKSIIEDGVRRKIAEM